MRFHVGDRGVRLSRFFGFNHLTGCTLFTAVMADPPAYNDEESKRNKDDRNNLPVLCEELLAELPVIAQDRSKPDNDAVPGQC